MEFRDKLKANGCQNGEILQSVDLALLVKRSAYTIGNALEKISDFAKLDMDKATMHQNVLNQEVRFNYLLKQNASLGDLDSKNSQTLQELENVNELGFGLQVLRILRHELDEVGEQAGKPTASKDSVERLFRFFNDYYCDYYNLDDKVKEMQSSILRI